MSPIKEHVKYRKKHLDRIAQTMLNNKELCDVTFVINKKQYHACRSMMTVTSQVFATLLKEHFENTTDEKLILQGIKHGESFYNMLCYIHGVDIDLTAMSKVVLCELLHLADRYKLTELHADLKIYISKLRRFKLNSIVTLLNTSKTHDLSYLYDRLKTYVYQHIELFIKHETFVDLNYDVLVDLLQSDWFCAAEIDLLKATLTWHDKNIMYTRKQEQIDNDYEVKNDHAGDTQGEANLNEDCCSNSSKADDSWTEIYPIEDFLNKYSDDLFIFDDSDKESTNMSFDKVNDKLVVHELSSQESTDHSNNSEINYPNETADRSEGGNIPDKTNKSEAKVVEIVSGNILKTLLVHIRFSRIPMFDFQKALNTDELITKFKDDIMELINSSELNNKPRNIYTGFTKILKVKITRKKLNANVPFYSKRFYIKNQPWAICAYYNDEGYCTVSLEHYSNLKLRWESDVVYQLTMISHKPFVEDMHAHNFNNDDDECFELHTFDHSEDNCFILHDLTDVSTFLDDDNGFMQNDTITFELHIIKFDFKCLCHVCQDETGTNEGQGSSEHINSPDHKMASWLQSTFLLAWLFLGSHALVNVHKVLQKIHEKNVELVKNMNQICPGPSVHREGLFGTGQPRNKRQVMSGVPLEQTADLAGLQLLNAQKILEALSAEMTNAIFIGYKTATANVNLGSREGPKVLPLGTTLEDLLKSYKIYRTTYTSYIEGWVHRVIHDMPSELKKIERNEIFHFSARDPGVYPSQVDLMKYWSYDQVMDKDVEIFARSIRDRLICMYEAFEDIFYQDVYKPNFVTMKRTG